MEWNKNRKRGWEGQTSRKDWSVVTVLTGDWSISASVSRTPARLSSEHFSCSKGDLWHGPGREHGTVGTGMRARRRQRQINTGSKDDPQKGKSVHVTGFFSSTPRAHHPGSKHRSRTWSQETGFYRCRKWIFERCKIWELHSIQSISLELQLQFWLDTVYSSCLMLRQLPRGQQLPAGT